MSPPPLVTEKFVKNIVNENPETFRSLYALDLFAAGIENCIDAGVCESTAAHNLFGKFMNDVYCLYNPVFPDIAKKLQMNQFGMAVESFSNRFGRCH